MTRFHSSLALLLFFCLNGCDTTGVTKPNFEDCMLDNRNNSYGLVEVRIQCGKIHVLEVQIPGYDEGYLFYRILTDGLALIEEYFGSRNQLMECRVSENNSAIADFIASFNIPLYQSVNLGNLSVITDEVGGQANRFFTQDDKLEEILDVPYHKLQCSVFHEEKYKAILGANKALQVNVQNIIGGKEALVPKAKKVNNNETDVNGGMNKRKKRFVFVEGTNWCGIGNRADNYDDLGPERETDICCRDHDRCDVKIKRFQRKYNYFNWRLYTINHQSCDMRLYACLKNDGSATSNFVGDVFFNRLGIPSFKVEPRKYCVRRRWYGTCAEWGTRETAVIYDAVHY